MADPCRERIAAAMLVILQAIAGVTAERNRRAPLTEAEIGAGRRLVLFEGGEEPLEDFTFEDAWSLQLIVQGAIAGADAAAATTANLLRADVQRAVLADLTLGGLVRDIRPADAGDWIGVESESSDVEGFMMAFRVTYATKEGDPFTFADGG